jgi:hypothetical protein
MFTHYMGGLRRDEDDAPRAAGPPWLARGAAVAVVLVIALGMFIAGAPARVRLEALDQRRINDLQGISNDVMGFHELQGRAPESLDEVLAKQPGASSSRVLDPVTRVPYEYRTIDSMSFELCASFDRPDSAGPFSRDVAPFWRHGTGRACYTFQFRRVSPGQPR